MKAAVIHVLLLQEEQHLAFPVQGSQEERPPCCFPTRPAGQGCAAAAESPRFGAFKQDKIVLQPGFLSSIAKSHRVVTLWELQYTYHRTSESTHFFLEAAVPHVFGETSCRTVKCFCVSRKKKAQKGSPRSAHSDTSHSRYFYLKTPLQTGLTIRGDIIILIITVLTSAGGRHISASKLCDVF